LFLNKRFNLQELGQHLEMVTSLVVNIGQLGWQKFDVTKVVSRWYTTNYSKDKLTLLVDCSGCGSHVHVSTFDGHSPHVIESSLNSKGNTWRKFRKIRQMFDKCSIHLSNLRISKIAYFCMTDAIFYIFWILCIIKNVRKFIFSFLHKYLYNIISF